MGVRRGARRELVAVAGLSALHRHRPKRRSTEFSRCSIASFCPTTRSLLSVRATRWCSASCRADVHVEWALAQVATRRMATTSTTRRLLRPFPFPSDDTGLTPALTDHIRTLAEQIDAHRKARQAAHEGVTLTGLYNVLAKLRAEQPLTAKEKAIHEHGLVAVLRSLHDELDAAVLSPTAGPICNPPSPTTARRQPRRAPRRWRRCSNAWWHSMRSARPRKPPARCAGCGRSSSARQGGAGRPGREGRDRRPARRRRTAGGAARASRTRPWPAGLPEQIKAVAELLSGSPQRPGAGRPRTALQGTRALARAAAGDPRHAGRAGPRGGRCRSAGNPPDAASSAFQRGAPTA